VETSKPNARKALLVLLCVSIPSFMINLDANIVAVSLPSISKSLNADFTAIEWVISAYTLTFASLVLPAGTLSDRYGRKLILLVGLSIFTVASVFCGAASTALILNVARAVQGVGAALLLSSGLALLSFEFQGPQRAKAFAFWGSVIGVAITLGPLCGGVITETIGWEWAFYLNIPIGIFVGILTVTSVSESKDPHAKTLDVPGFASFAIALGLVTSALISGNHVGWGSFSIIAQFSTSAVFFAAFIVIESRHHRPMLDLNFFRFPTYIGANIAGLAYAACVLTMLTYLPLFFQSALGLTPKQSGLFMLPMAVPIFLMPRLVSRYLTHRLSGRTLITTGLGLSSIGLLVLGLEVFELSYLAILPGMLIVGVSAGFLNGETAKVSMTVIPPERAGMAAGVGGTIRFAGIVIGFAAMGAILFNRVSYVLGSAATSLGAESQTIVQRLIAGDHRAVASLGDAGVASNAIASGYSTVFLTAAVLAGVAAAAAWLLISADDTKAASRTAHINEVALPVE
jgi:EmrB/QacA subfamily drug resistance transporter